MEKKPSRIPWFGVALILFGLLLLVDKLDWVNLSFHEVFWPIVMLLSLAGVGRGFAQGKRGKIFFSTTAFLFALFFLLQSIESLEVSGDLVVASTFLIFGTACLMVWCNDFRDWFYLIPAACLGGIGTALLLSELGYISHWAIMDAVEIYWPLGLILFGLGMILRRKMHPADTNAPATP